MFEWFGHAVSQATAAIVFFSIFTFGVVVSSISLFFGGHDDHDADGGDTDTDHDSDSEHDSEHADGESDSAISTFHGVNMGLLSLRGLCLLSVGLGGVGFVVQIQTGRVVFATVAGLLSGYVFAIAILYLLRIFKSQQANSLTDHSGAVGSQAVVTTSIPENGPGEIRVSITGKEVYKMAVASDGKAIRAGALVIIESISGGSAVVSPVNQ